MRKVFTLLAVVATIVTVSAAHAAPLSANLDFTWDGAKGTLTVLHQLSARPAGFCTFRLRAAIGGEGQKVLDIRGKVVSRFQSGKRTNRLTLRSLPGVRSLGGKDPVLTLQGQTRCGSQKIVSNAVARFVKCGANIPQVTPRRFLEIIEARAR